MLPGRRAGGVSRRPGPAGPDGHLEPFAASAHGRDLAAHPLARPGRCRGRQRGAPAAGLARLRPPPAAPLPPHADRAPGRTLRPFPLGGWTGAAAGLAAGPHRLSPGRRRPARAVDHRVDAQPRAHDRRLVPGQAPAGALAGGCRLVLGHPGGCGPGQQHHGLAVDRRLRRRCRALLPRSSTRCCRAGATIRPGRTSAAGCRNWPDCPTAGCTHPGRRRRWCWPEAGVVLGRTYPLPIVDHAEARARTLAAWARIKGG